MAELAAAEVDPASEWCQRWDGRQHSWRHRSDAISGPVHAVLPKGRRTNGYLIHGKVLAKR